MDDHGHQNGAHYAMSASDASAEQIQPLFPAQSGPVNYDEILFPATASKPEGSLSQMTRNLQPKAKALGEAITSTVHSAVAQCLPTPSLPGGTELPASVPEAEVIELHLSASQSLGNDTAAAPPLALKGS
ncbi:hypothetical protein IAT40_007419 [Kwoniella sp. CBS 6097]